MIPPKLVSLLLKKVEVFLGKIIFFGEEYTKRGIFADSKILDQEKSFPFSPQSP